MAHSVPRVSRASTRRISGCPSPATSSIQGERQWSDEAREAGHDHQECSFGKVERLSLPSSAETGRIKAPYGDGALTVKPEEIMIDAV